MPRDGGESSVSPRSDHSTGQLRLHGYSYIQQSLEVVGGTHVAIIDDLVARGTSHLPNDASNMKDVYACLDMALSSADCLILPEHKGESNC